MHLFVLSASYSEFNKYTQFDSNHDELGLLSETLQDSAAISKKNILSMHSKYVFSILFEINNVFCGALI